MKLGVNAVEDRVNAQQSGDILRRDAVAIRSDR